MGSALCAGHNIFAAESAAGWLGQGVCQVGKLEYANDFNCAFLIGPAGGLNGESERHRNRLGTEPGVHTSAPAKKRPCQSAVKLRGGPLENHDFHNSGKGERHEIIGFFVTLKSP